ncbi:Tautomerase enzyme [Achromobacter sp. 2789STDY5608615]|uniref:tautomerase family protein n=1 Tax=Achromobacter sp. 2789STDY5608615 TaxID=1806492 RepID=UPI0006C4090D|nr:tautomerase family protein [Achromobacter sp. 2789STDY5608615]CUK20087.1 Tautomerase enzyme [Achromobacter sp. 2789STDY5608615]
MPLVRIDIRKHADPLFARKIGEVVYRAMRTTIGVPDKDNFQILNEHDGGHFVYDPSYLAIADGLHAELAIRREDVFISLVEVKKENWSFGNGLAQYAN